MASICITNGYEAEKDLVGKVLLFYRDGKTTRGVVQSSTGTLITFGPMFAQINRKLRKCHARYRRGREGVRPRHRGRR